MTEGIINLQHLDEVRIKFTELGDAIKETQEKNQDSFNSMMEKLSSDLASAVDEMGKSSNLQEVSNMAGLSQEYVNHVAKGFRKVSKSLQLSIDGMNSTIHGTETGFENLSRGSKKLLLKLAKEQVDGDKKKGTGMVSKLGRKEWSTFKGSIGKAMSALKIPKLGGIAAGAMDIMFHGYKDADRVRQEAGEVKNILIAAYDSGVKGAVAKGTQTLSTMQESLQQYLGINKKGVQSVAQAFVDGGLSIDQMLAKTSQSILHAKDTVISTTLALDKMFEIPDGSSAKRMVSFMTDYGKSTEEALSSVIRLQSLGRDSGIGAAQYVKNVEGASKSLSSMGFNIDNVVDIYDHVTKSFSKMGVPKQFAGKHAAMGMQQVAGGIEKMSDEWKVIIGERLGYGRGLDARQKLMDAFLRVREGDSGNEVLKIIEVMHGISMNASGGDENKAMLMMEKQMGIGFEGAKLVMNVMKDVKSGNLVKAAKAAKENSGLLYNALAVEAERASKFELMMNSWMKGLAKLGQGLMGWALRSIAMLLAYIRASMSMLMNYLLGDDDANVRIAKSIEKMLGTGDASKKKMSEGLDQMIAAARAMGSDILGDSLAALKSAILFDPLHNEAFDMNGDYDTQLSLQKEFGVIPGKGTELERDSSSQKGYQFVPKGTSSAPDMTPDEYLGNFSRSNSSDTAAGGRASPQGGGASYGAGGSYADLGGYVNENSGIIPGDEGGGIVISAGGVNAEGDIELTLGGSCPKCGYKVGGRGADGTGMTDLDVLTQMLYTEGSVGKINKKHGKRELAGIAFTALNRIRKGQATDMEDAVTSGHGFGVQGNKRQYGTNRARTSKTDAEYNQVRNFASEILAGKVENPVGDATMFYHNTFGAGYGGGRDPSKATARPKYADKAVNTANIGTARYYADKGIKAADADRRDAGYQKRFDEKHPGLT